MRMTPQRAAIDDLLDGTDDFRTAQQLHGMLASAGSTIGLATVYRTLTALAEAGRVDVLRNDEGEALFRRCLRAEHHHHLVCRDCGRTVEIAADVVERWASTIARENGFIEIDHTAEIFGTCSRCAAARYAGAQHA
ncbi:transcriptional repressor [Pseudactinotalea sp. HY160]|uniref:Fur family transcriptional regulator n=1 Tax=Pseudactinotalea sp. HY160 TaxID=2654490 RepID=UPI00128CE8F8|nr:Fur family transcriptional regulator [Pseudactinotalea sp. HY160]MPV49780.1 transcriptional repressor [Pseudactinotalea sp. HY160]